MVWLNQNINSSDGNETYSMSKELYLRTGDVVLLCQSVACRVHEEHMVNRSPLLKKMLEVSRRSRPRLHFDTCPAIKVSGKIAPLETLLKVVYIPLFRNTFFESVNGVELLELTEISFEYGVESVFELCCRRLAYFYPARLEQWALVPGPRPDPCLVINLSRRIDKPIFLPAAFYNLVTTTLRTCPSHHLHRKDEPLCKSMKIGLHQMWLVFLERESQLAPKCENAVCHAKWLEFQQAIKLGLGLGLREESESFHGDKYVKDSLSQFLDYICRVRDCDGLCSDEISSAIFRAQQYRYIVWNRLPTFMGQSSWQALEQYASARTKNNETSYPLTGSRMVSYRPGSSELVNPAGQNSRSKRILGPLDMNVYG